RTEGTWHSVAPVRRRFGPFPHDLSPGAELEPGDRFATPGIKRQRTEAFDRLSDGTQEQIAVPVRLAMGVMLAERGEAAPIILDDALVYCDDDRIQRMFDALNRGRQEPTDHRTDLPIAKLRATRRSKLYAWTRLPSPNLHSAKRMSRTPVHGSPIHAVSDYS